MKAISKPVVRKPMTARMAPTPSTPICRKPAATLVERPIMEVKKFALKSSSCKRVSLSPNCCSRYLLRLKVRMVRWFSKFSCTRPALPDCRSSRERPNLRARGPKGLGAKAIIGMSISATIASRHSITNNRIRLVTMVTRRMQKLGKPRTSAVSIAITSGPKQATMSPCGVLLKKSVDCFCRLANIFSCRLLEMREPMVAVPKSCISPAPALSRKPTASTPSKIANKPMSLLTMALSKM